MNNKYKIGFTAGTFDMFHIGHLNLLKRAKERCEYLIVGVNSDELVQTYKKKTPVINEEHRLEIIKSLDVVDEVLLTKTLDKIEVHTSIPFNVVFIGDDWKGSERWNETERRLKMLDVDVCYLNYTRGISSTQIVNKIAEMSKAHVN